MDTSIQDICDMLGIKKRTFHRDRRMLKGEKTDIPFGRMRKYAQLFKVQLLQLCNEDIDQPSYEDIKKARERAMDTSTGIVNDFNLSWSRFSTPSGHIKTNKNYGYSNV